MRENIVSKLNQTTQNSSLTMNLSTFNNFGSN